MNDERYSFHAKIIIISFSPLSIVVLVTTYCGNLVAFLTFPTMEKSVDMLQDLVQKEGTLKWGLRGGSYLEEFMREATTGKYQVTMNVKIAENRRRDSVFKTNYVEM